MLSVAFQNIIIIHELQNKYLPSQMYQQVALSMHVKLQMDVKYIFKHKPTTFWNPLVVHHIYPVPYIHD